MNELTNPLFNKQQQEINSINSPTTMHTTSATITLSTPKVNNQSPMLPIKVNQSPIDRINQNNDLKTNKNTNEQSVSECINENLNSVQDIIEHFQQYSKRNSNNQSVLNNNNSESNNISSPNVNSIIQNLNNSAATNKSQQTNFAAIAHRPTSVVTKLFY